MPDLKRVDTIVHLILENRSFDHVLGHLSLTGASQADGLKKPLTKNAYKNTYSGNAYYPFEMADAWFPGDLPHHRGEIEAQVAPKQNGNGFLMNGFVRAYFEYADHKGFEIPDPSKPEAMGFLPASAVPITTFLAQEYAVCDRWFCPLPTASQSNWLLGLSGRSRSDVIDVFPPGSGDPFVIDWLQSRRVRWRVYHDGFSIFSLFGRFDVMFDERKFRPLSQLEADVKAEPVASFPQVILIESDYESSPQFGGKQANDNHPPLPMAPGEQLLQRVYQALTSNPKRWEKTVFIVTYDEHGGFYDHVEPLKIGYAPPDGEYPPFTNTGPRVPSLVVSPLVSRGRVYSEWMDHTSILQFIAERFSGPNGDGYSHEVNERRDKGIRSVSRVLNRNQPRKRIPTIEEFAPPTPPRVDGPSGEPSDLQERFYEAVKRMIKEYPEETRDRLPGLPPAELSSAPDEPDEIEVTIPRDLVGPTGSTRLKDVSQDVMSVAVRRQLTRPLTDNTEETDHEVQVFVRAGISGQVSAFNSADDKDPDGILVARNDGEADDEEPEEITLDIPAQVSLDPRHAWMKYAFDADISGGVSGNLKNLGFSFSADKKLRIADYRRHSRDGIFLPTILSDLRHARLALRIDDVMKLKTHEALLMQSIGEIRTNVTLSWADVFTSQFGNLGILLNTDDVIPLKFSAGMSLSASVGFTDDFIVAFSRPEEGSIRIAVRKAKQRQTDYSFETSVRVTLPFQAVEAALENVVEGVLGMPLGQAWQLLEGDAPNLLTDPKVGILLKLLPKLGLRPVADTLKELKEAIKEAKKALADFEERVKKAVEEIAHEKITAGFKFEYGRLDTSATMLQAVMRDQDLGTYHRQLIRRDITPLLNAIQTETPGIEPESYLNRKSVKVERAWGFTLGFGRWSMFGRSTEAVTRTEDRNIDGDKKYLYHGRRGYRSRLGEEVTWMIDFRADMERFSAYQAPRMSEYRFGLTLVWERSGRMSREKIKEMLDHAVLWKVCSARSVSMMTEKLAPCVGKKCDLVLQVRVDDDLFRAILPSLAQATSSDLSDALGAAMSWMRHYPSKQSVTSRRLHYGPLWRAYFRHPAASSNDLRATAVDYLRKDMDEDLLADLEDRVQHPDPFTFTGLAHLNDRTIVDVEKFNAGMAQLSDGIDRDLPDNGLIAEVYKKIRYLGKHSHHVRALGYYVGELAEARNAWADLECILRVDSGDDTFVFGM